MLLSSVAKDSNRNHIDCYMRYKTALTIICVQHKRDFETCSAIKASPSFCRRDDMNYSHFIRMSWDLMRIPQTTPKLVAYGISNSLSIESFFLYFWEVNRVSIRSLLGFGSHTLIILHRINKVPRGFLCSHFTSAWCAWLLSPLTIDRIYACFLNPRKQKLHKQIECYCYPLFLMLQNWQPSGLFQLSYVTTTAHELSHGVKWVFRESQIYY